MHCSIKRNNGGDIIPPVLHQCVSFLREHGMHLLCELPASVLVSLSQIIVFHSDMYNFCLIGRLLWSYYQLDPVSQNRIFADNGSKMLFLTLNQQCQSTEGVVVLTCFIQLTFSYDGLTEQIATNHNL